MVGTILNIILTISVVLLGLCAIVSAFHPKLRPTSEIVSVALVIVGIINLCVGYTLYLHL